MITKSFFTGLVWPVLSPQSPVTLEPKELIAVSANSRQQEEANSRPALSSPIIRHDEKPIKWTCLSQPKELWQFTWNVSASGTAHIVRVGFDVTKSAAKRGIAAESRLCRPLRNNGGRPTSSMVRKAGKL